MYPAAEDNYGYDACAVVCLPCVPNILVIATESGTLYHCIVLEAEDEDEHTGSATGQGEAQRWARGSEAVPSLYVFECVELELALKLATGEEEESVESDFTCPIRLHHGKIHTPLYSRSPCLSSIWIGHWGGGTFSLRMVFHRTRYHIVGTFPFSIDFQSGTRQTTWGASVP